MADPFSPIGCLLGILSSLQAISQAVTRIVDDVRNASLEIRCLSRDIHAFFSLIRSLDIALREQDVRNIVESNEAILYQIHGLEESLRNCRDVLTKLMVKHEEFRKKNDGMGFRKLRWAIFTKGEVRSLQSPLETMKSTLNSALNAVNILVSMRILAIIRSSTTSATRHSGEQILDSISSLVYQTHLSIVSDDRELSQQVVCIYRRLGERREQMQRLRTTNARTQQSSHDSSTVEIFLDFVSRFSVNGPNSTIDRLLGAISGRPDYLLETSPSFYPEQFDTALPHRMMSISAILPLPSHPRTQRYFMTFQEKARKWQRVIVVATFENFRDPSAMIHVSAVANLRLMCRMIPEPLKRPLQNLFREIENFGSVTNVFVNLRENENGQIVADMTRVHKAENLLERHMSNENKMLQDIEHLGCPQFVESQVIFRAQLSCYRYKVWVGDRGSTECKVPFASAGLQDDNLFDDFTDEVKRLTSLRGCGGIVQFLGVILDESRRHIKGYLYEDLYEAPTFSSLRINMGLANSQSEPIPWAVRELWIGQIVAAMSNVHARGLIIGALNNNRISIRADGSVVLDLSENAHRSLRTQRDCLPPGLWRMNFGTCRIPRSSPLNFQTDIFSSDTRFG